MRRRYMQAGVLAISADSWGIEFEYSLARDQFVVRGEYAVVDICGPLVQRAEPCWASYEEIESNVCAAFESSAPKVLLRINSPGGMVAGCFELVETIKSKALAAGKVVEAYVDGMAASAAYALACSASRIYAPATAIVGSIGCIQVAMDQSAADRAMGLAFEIFASGARKADGNPHTPMSDSARTSIQGQVDEMAQTFFATVSAARGIDATKVEALQAECFVATKGFELGLVDEIATLEQVIAGAAGVKTATAAEVDMSMSAKDLRAALQALAESDDEKEAKRAKKALAAYESDDEDEEKKDKSDAKAEDEKDEPKAKAEDDSGEKKDDEKKDDSEAKALAAVVAEVRAMKAELSAKKEADERAALLASRSDLSGEVVAFLERSPLSVVRDAVKSLPRGAAKGTVNQARAALGVTATVQPASDPRAGRLPPEEKAALDERMGIKARKPQIGMQGNAGVFGVMTAEDAKAFLESRKGSK